MIVAKEKYLEEFEWGKGNLFHSIDFEGKTFHLFDYVTIVTKSNKTIEGTIVFIMHEQIDIMMDTDSKTIKFNNIASISI